MNSRKFEFFRGVFIKKNNWKLDVVITPRNRHGFFRAFVGFHGMGSRLTLAILAWIGADHAAHSQLQSPGLVRVKPYRRHPLEVKTKGAKQKDLGCRAAAFFAALEKYIFLWIQTLVCCSCSTESETEHVYKIWAELVLISLRYDRNKFYFVFLKGFDQKINSRTTRWKRG